MKALLLVVLLLGCEDRPAFPQPDEFELADQNCKPYLAVPGEPCKDGHWLYIDGLSRYPRPAVCSCDAVKSKAH